MWSLKLLTIIQSLPGLRTVYTLFLLQIIEVSGVDILHILERTFAYDFNILPARGNVLIWRISENHRPFQPLQYNGQDFHLGSEETYLLLAQKFSKMYILHYWLGKNTSLIDKKVAAKYAMLLSQLSKITNIQEFEWLNITRETEGMESDSFQHTMNMHNRRAHPYDPFDLFAMYLERHLPSPRPNLYVLQGETHSRFKKIPMSLGLRWLVKKEICIVLELEYKVKDMPPVNLFCGKNANKHQFIRSRNFANSLAIYSPPWRIYSHQIENNRHSVGFKQFIEVLEESQFYNLKEEDDSGDHLKDAAEFVIHRDREISLFDVTSNELIENRRRPVRTCICNSRNMGHLLDTKSVAGVFLEFAELKNFNKKLKAIKLTEEYLYKTYPISSRQTIKLRIIETNLNRYIRDFVINMSDYPIRDHLPDDELW